MWGRRVDSDQILTLKALQSHVLACFLVFIPRFIIVILLVLPVLPPIVIQRLPNLLNEFHLCSLVLMAPETSSGSNLDGILG